MDGVTWIWKRMKKVAELERIDPHNPLLQFGFHGLPFFGWKGD